MRTLRFVIQILLLLIAGVLMGCSSTKVSLAEKYQKKSAQELFQSGKSAMMTGNYATATEYFEALDTLYPFNEYAEQAQLNLIYAYYRKDDDPSAVSAAERFIHLYPRSTLVDYAYYMRGVAGFEQDRGTLQRLMPMDPADRDVTYARTAFTRFNELVTRFPNSAYVPDATQRMVYLRALLARHEIEIADYYMRRGAYVAAVNRANQVIQYYQQSPSVVDALIILVKANRALRLTKPADEALTVLKINFPNSPHLPALEVDR